MNEAQLEALEASVTLERVRKTVDELRSRQRGAGGGVVLLYRVAEALAGDLIPLKPAERDRALARVRQAIVRAVENSPGMTCLPAT
jgi:hypothetical protein